MSKNSVFTASHVGIAPERTAKRNAMEKTVLNVFEQYGYSEVTLPMYEYYDVLKSVTLNFRDENIISFIDRNSGKTLVLRPDFTPQVCRMVAGYHESYPLPIRMYYRGAVFRNVDIEQGAKSEKHQIGCELYGTSEKAGDMELILCISRVLKGLKIGDYRIVFGDAAFVSRVRDLLISMVGNVACKEYFDILSCKKLHALDGFIAKNELDTPMKILLKALPVSFGGESALVDLAKLSGFDLELKARLIYISELFQLLKKHGVDADRLVFDAGDIRGMGYYTGITFEILHTTTGALVGAGGRYDNLMERYHLGYSACGMALYIAELEDAADFSLVEIEFDWVVVGEENMEKAEKLRNDGLKVFFLPDRAELEKSSHLIKTKNTLV